MFKRIQSVLLGGEERDILEKTVELWLSEIRDVAYDAEDILDEFQYEVLCAQVKARSDGAKDEDINYIRHAEKKQKVSVPANNCSGLIRILLESNIKERIGDIKNILYEISESRKEYWLGDEHGKRRSNSIKYSPSPTTYQVKSNVYGRDTEKEEVIQLLVTENVPKLSVVAIIGKGGIGKTTLAQLVYNDHKVSEYFDIRSWIYVSEEFDIFRIAKTIVHELTKKPCDINELSLLTKTLEDELKGKQLLLVLDDVWNEMLSPWETLEDLLSGAKTVRILLTTRNETVTVVMKNVNLFHLRDLPETECWQLFENCAFNGRDSSDMLHLVAIGREIVKKCHGLPLAAKSLGCLLRDKEDQDIWNDVLQSELWDLAPQDGILPALKLSYNRMPSYLKSCFAYCSIFPKGCQLNLDRLINLWIAQGFIQSRPGKSLEDTARRYIDELLGRSFLEFDPLTRHHMKMHDMIHELAKYVSNGECGAFIWGKLHRFSESDNHLRHLYFDASSECSVANPRHLRTFIDQTYYKNDRIYSVENMISLRALELTNRRFVSANFVIGNLKHLRYLHVSGGRFIKLPDSICYLFNLQTLHLNFLPIEVLPVEFGNLVSLKFLSLRCCRELKELPYSMGYLSNLCHLDLTYTAVGWFPTSFGGLRNLEVVYSGGQCIQITIDELKDLVKLKVPLKIGDLSNVVEVDDVKKVGLKNKHQIEYLLLSWYHPEPWWYGHTSYLTLVFPKQSGIVNDAIKKAEVVLENLCPHVDIKELSMYDYPSRQYPKWVRDLSLFAKLTKIKLRFCRPSHLPPLGQLPVLTHLNIGGCYVCGIGKEFYCFNENAARRAAFPMLKEMIIRSCQDLKTWDGMLDGDFPKLEKLCITYCNGLRTLPSIESFGMSDNLPARYPSWTSNNSFTELKDIVLRGTSIICILTLGQLPALASLCIEACRKIKMIGPLFCRSDSNVERTVAFPALTTLKLYYLHELEMWYGVCDGDFPQLRVLTIASCDKLTMLPILPPSVQLVKL